jgi:hypothetical protein
MKFDHSNNPSLGLGGAEFEALATAPSTEDIHRAMKSGKWLGSENCNGALGVLFEARHIEQFNFGPLSLDTIREAQKEAIEFIEFGCMSLPYPECVFRCSVAFDNRSVGFHLFAIERSKDNKTIATLATIHSEKEVLTFRSDNPLVIKDAPNIGKGVEVNIPGAEMKFWEPHIGDIKRTGFVEDSNGAILTEGTLILMGLVMILNTKGVLKERTAPPAKPNKVRAARGVPLLPYTTKVYTNVYNQAVRSGPAGTHASPRPHRRRAHIRRYPKTEKHDAYVLPIAAMLVNWDGQPLPDRAEYVVKNG